MLTNAVLRYRLGDKRSSHPSEVFKQESDPNTVTEIRTHFNSVEYTNYIPAEG